MFDTQTKSAYQFANEMPSELNLFPTRSVSGVASEVLHRDLRKRDKPGAAKQPRHLTPPAVRPETSGAWLLPSCDSTDNPRAGSQKHFFLCDMVHELCSEGIDKTTMAQAAFFLTLCVTSAILFIPVFHSLSPCLFLSIPAICPLHPLWMPGVALLGTTESVFWN